MIKHCRNGYKYGYFILADSEEYLFVNKHRYLVKAVKDIYDQDWKTAVTKGSPTIPKGTVVVVQDFIYNCYGEYFCIRYEGYLFYAKPSDFNYVSLI